MLQLGHGFFSVEMDECDDKINIEALLQLGHGFFSVEMCGYFRTCPFGSKSFNWATDFSPWKSLRAN